MFAAQDGAPEGRHHPSNAGAAGRGGGARNRPSRPPRRASPHRRLAS